MALTKTFSPLRQFVNDFVTPLDTRYRISSGRLPGTCTNKTRRRRRFRRPWRRGQLRLTGLLSRVQPLMRSPLKSFLRTFQLAKTGRHCAIPAELRRRVQYSRWTTSASFASVNVSRTLKAEKKRRVQSKKT